MKLEIVAKDMVKMNEAAVQYGCEVVSAKLISKCHLVVLEGTKDALMDFNDEFFFKNRDLHQNYMNEILSA
ncbi:hypothetical protein [Kosakonia phage Kc304]|nr:hypothetical protein [Kosakonia phage Kc304]